MDTNSASSKRNLHAVQFAFFRNEFIANVKEIAQQAKEAQQSLPKGEANDSPKDDTSALSGSDVNNHVSIDNEPKTGPMIKRPKRRAAKNINYADSKINYKRHR